MALGTLGTNSNTSLNALTFGASGTSGTGVVSPSDLAAISASIMGPGRFSATNGTGILATGSTHSNTTLDTLVFVSGGALSTIQIGDLVLGDGIIPGTFVTAKPTASSVTLSQAATATASAVRIGIIPIGGDSGRLSFEGLLSIPARGVLKVLPGDIVAIDNTGWPILVSAQAVAYPGSRWHKV